ncbi:extracellular solute-binding protein [Cellulomonas sp. PhB143]|uniref:extracellular solute-binding protein n=1 Tax=Cellulomonas sp. PhB143 TaxID=2485186 RepID=UPI000F4916CA|nr:extracellular solute-binding protein [Cellulomonas sp. PhB143]ROS76883.1 carbohydrate ABC transporter substrate-binding protein (CUT1 family) [Cellulomonas sp. PhB143]
MRTPLFRGRRRALATVATAGALALALTACGSSGPSDTSADGGDRGSSTGDIWVITDASLNPVQEKSAETFATSGDVTFTVSNYANDPYKQKLQTAIGSPNQPDIFYNWGGGNLKQYVDAGQVADLTSAVDGDADFKSKLIPSVLDVGTIDGKIYGLPMQGVQPVMMYGNDDVLKKAGVDGMPATWDDLLADVKALKASGVTPIALAGSQSWTELMWLEYLLDRVGGSDKFAAIAAGDDGAWSDPAVIESLTMIQQLVDAGAFGTNYSAVGYDDQGTQALIAGGKAGLELMGSWEVSALNASFPDFAKSDSLVWGTFPTVDGGKGDPSAVVGNPSNFYSVTDGSKVKDGATQYLLDTLTSDEYVDGLLSIGQVPAITGLEEKVKTGDFAHFNAFTYQIVNDSSSFTQSWDQALDAATAQTMLTNLQKVFLGQMEPQEFADAMAK